MIQRLYIKNYAIINEIDMHFHDHLTVMTGETGAGKSIILEALSLILGERADSSVILDEATKCVIEGTFDVRKNARIKEKLVEREFDLENDVLILRREINAQGKSRAFINDTPCTIGDLQYLQTDLIDINKQFDNQQIKNDNYVINWIDIFAENQKNLIHYTDLYKTYSALKSEYKTLVDQKANIEKERDYIQFQVQEILQLQLKAGEIETLEEQIKQIDNQSDINKLIQESSYLLSESEMNVVQSLQKITSNVQQLSQFNSKYELLVSRLNSTVEELKDISYEITDNESNIEITESEFQEMNQRYSDAQRLLKKHGLQNTEELLSLLASLESQNADFDSLDEKLVDIENQIIKIELELKGWAEALSVNRQEAVQNIVPLMLDVLKNVGLNSAEIKLDLTRATILKPNGYDELDFLIDFNKTQQFLPLSKAGSGGELSRLLLAMKSVIGDKHDDTTFIFDEIDSAISGEVAKQVAILIKKISLRNQVIVLTHQPQMAAKGDVHFHLYKHINLEKNRNQTHIKTLDPQQRIEYIAQMMSGENMTESALTSAREMIENK